MNYVMRHGRRIEIETEPLNIGHTPKRRRPFKAGFVIVPWSWVEALKHAGPGNGYVYELALAVLAERYKRKQVGGEVVISAKTVPGMPRTSRWRATKRLVQLGLIKVAKVSYHAAPRVLAFQD